jgi:hypothetical protein
MGAGIVNKKRKVRRALAIAFYALAISSAVLFPFGAHPELGGASWSIWGRDKNDYPWDFPHLVVPVTVLLVLLTFVCWQLRANRRRKLRQHETSKGVGESGRERRGQQNSPDASSAGGVIEPHESSGRE